MHRNQRDQIIVGEGLITAHVAGDAEIVERHEDAVGADEAHHEVNLAKGLVHHAAGHFGKPEVGSGEDAEHGGDSHYEVEVADHEVSGVQHDVNRGLGEEESADAAADKHRNETQGEKRCRVDAQFRAVQTAQPDQNDDRGRNGNDQRGEGEGQGGDGIHSADEHVVAGNHVAQGSQGSHGINENSMAEHGLAHVGDQHVRNDAHTGDDGDVNLGVTEEPEQMLPEQSRPSGVGQDLVVDDEVGGDEETGSGDVIENEQDAGGHQDRECGQ